MANRSFFYGSLVIPYAAAKSLATHTARCWPDRNAGDAGINGAWEWGGGEGTVERHSRERFNAGAGSILQSSMAMLRSRRLLLLSSLFLSPFSEAFEVL